MKKNNLLNNGIPVSVSLNPTLEAENFEPRKGENKKRLFIVSAIAIVVAMCTSVIAKLLVYLIDIFTNLAFHGTFSIEPSAPAPNSLGWFGIFIPVIGGVVVGLMALYGSKAIRGHGIPEAMEQILTNQSKIRPAITYLKPISSAISIGTGGPFGAEGPIIATGGALGSTVGQLLKISHHERKVLLASGATAGMSAIFGSPIAAIFLAVELLLFEFSPRSLIPVSLACITGAAGHHLLFSSEPVFAMSEITSPSNTALAAYSAIGIVIGLLASLVIKAVYYIEDLFEKLPLHWMWWPAIGGFAVGVVGFFYPATLGVGYENISHLLTGNMTLQLVLSLCIFKFISWAIALGSGTSGGTLAPLLTIGGATGCLLGMLTIALFPQYGVVLPLAALVGMSAMFAGASRALLTSIVFALETTAQANALLPLLGACVASYFVSFFLMRNTIMTEKIARRGVKTPHSYQQDILEAINVEQVMSQEEIVLNEKNTIDEVRGWLSEEKEESYNHFIVVNDAHEFTGLLDSHTLFNKTTSEKDPIGNLVTKHLTAVQKEDNLRTAVELMAKENSEVLPVLDEGKTIVGVLTYKDIIGAYRQDAENYVQKDAQISMKKQGLKLLLKGRKLVVSVKRKDG